MCGGLRIDLAQAKILGYDRYIRESSGEIPTAIEITPGGEIPGPDEAEWTLVKGALGDLNQTWVRIKDTLPT